MASRAAKRPRAKPCLSPVSPGLQPKVRAPAAAAGLARAAARHRAYRVAPEHAVAPGRGPLAELLAALPAGSAKPKPAKAPKPAEPKKAAKPEKPKKPEKLSYEDAEEILFTYLRQSNRPYNAQCIFDNLHGRVPKGYVVPLLDKLVLDGRLRSKPYGASKVYIVAPEQLGDVSEEAGGLLAAEVKQLEEEEEQALKAKVRVLSKQQAGAVTAGKLAAQGDLTPEDMVRGLPEVEVEVQKYRLKLQVLDLQAGFDELSSEDPAGLRTLHSNVEKLVEDVEKLVRHDLGEPRAGVGRSGNRTWTTAEIARVVTLRLVGRNVHTLRAATSRSAATDAILRDQAHEKYVAARNGDRTFHHAVLLRICKDVAAAEFHQNRQNRRKVVEVQDVLGDLVAEQRTTKRCWDAIEAHLRIRLPRSDDASTVASEGEQTQ